MKSFTRLATLFSFIELIAASTETFYWEVSASGTDVDGFNIYVNSTYTNIMLSSYDGSLSAQILDDGTLVHDGETMGQGKNYLSMESLSTSWVAAEPWSISDGLLLLYGSSFHALPSGLDDGSYVLGTINAAKGRSDVVLVDIIPKDADGNVLADFTPGSSSSESSTETSTSSTSTSTSSSSSSSTSTTSSTASSTAESSAVSSSSTSTDTTTEGAESASTSVESSDAETTAASSTDVASSSEMDMMSMDDTTVESTTASSSEMSMDATTLESSTASSVAVETSTSNNTESTETTASIETYNNGAIANYISFGALAAAAAILI